MGCQSEIAAQIISQNAHYLLAVKGNQPTLQEEIQEYFTWALEDPIERKQLDMHTDTSFDHGKTVRWRVVSTQDVLWFESKEKWPGLRSFVMVQRTTKSGENVSTQTALYISSLEASAQTFHRLARGHWSVENQLHWSLDVSFSEDACLVGKDHAPANLSLLRKMALLLLRLDSSPHSAPRKMRLAAYDNDFAFNLLHSLK